MRAVALALMVLAWPAHADECGGRDDPCEIEGGGYHIVLPEGGATAGTVMHLHGAGASGNGALRGGLAREALKRGYAFIAPNGEHPEGRFKKNWSVKATGSSFKRDDIEFLRAVQADAEARHGAPRDHVLLSGFSRGASMVWDIACQAPDMATGFAPAAGAFWDTLPEDCERPVDLHHTHGWTDRTVPLEGRSLRGGQVVQGDAWASLFILRAVNGCAARQPERSKIEGERWWRYWTDCAEGSITLMLHPGGHGLPKGWAVEILDWFEALEG
jgi:polyhydroxybutyrate depolymerase